MNNMDVEVFRGKHIEACNLLPNSPILGWSNGWLERKMDRCDKASTVK